MVRELLLWGRGLGEGGGAQGVLFDDGTFEAREADDGQVPVSPGEGERGSRVLASRMEEKKKKKKVGESERTSSLQRTGEQEGQRSRGPKAGKQER